jgi:hypothetical protein
MNVLERVGDAGVPRAEATRDPVRLVFLDVVPPASRG